MKEFNAVAGLLLQAAIAAGAAEPDAGVRPTPAGFTALFNGKDLAGFADVEKAGGNWKADGGLLVNDGKGPNLATAKSYHNFELRLDWKIPARGDSGVFLPGGQQVQIWAKAGGSGGFVWNHKYSVVPAVVADRPLNEWNTMHIRLLDGKVTVRLNDKPVMTDVPVEKGFEPGKKGPVEGPIVFQRSPHSTPTWFRNVFIKDLDAK